MKAKTFFLSFIVSLTFITFCTFAEDNFNVRRAPQTRQIIAPVGSIVAWHKKISRRLPRGWVECNGQVLNDMGSPLDGEKIPDLNGENRFLRGSNRSGDIGGSTTHKHTRSRGKITYVWQRPDYNEVDNAANHLPPYMNVVWIMRVR